jgi:hypothetical protein
MRRTVLFIVLSLILLPPAGFAQQAAPGSSLPETAGSASPTPPATGAIPRNVVPQAGGPLFPDKESGLDKVANDGVSTKTVRAAPCSTAAQETDGFTTCVGIPNEPPHTPK